MEKTVRNAEESDPCVTIDAATYIQCIMLSFSPIFHDGITTS